MPEISLIDAKSGKLVPFKNAEEANAALLKTDMRGNPAYGADPIVNYMLFDSRNNTISPVSGGDINTRIGKKEFFGSSFATEEQTNAALKQRQQRLIGEAYEHQFGKGVLDLASMARIYGMAKGFMPIGVETAAEKQGLGPLAAYLREHHQSDIQTYEYGIPLAQLAVGLGVAGAAAFAGSTAAIPTAIGSLAYAGWKHLPKWVTKGGPEFIKMIARNKAVISMSKGAKGTFDVLNWQMRAVEKVGRGGAKAAQAVLKGAKPVTTAGGIAMRNISPGAAVPMVNMLLKGGATLATGTAKAAAHSGATGALYSVGAMETKHIIGDVEYSAENFMNHVMDGALFDVGLTGLVLSATAGGRLLKRGVEKVPVVGRVAKILPDVPVVDLSGQFLDMNKGMTKTGLSTMEPTAREKYTAGVVRAATVNGKIDQKKLNELLAKAGRDKEYVGDLHFILNDEQFGRDHGLDGPLLKIFDTPEELINRINMAKNKALANRNQGLSDLDNSPNFEAQRAKLSSLDEAEEAAARDHQVELDSRIERLANLEQQKKDLAQGKDEASVAGRRVAEEERRQLEIKINRLKSGEATQQEVLDELNNLDLSQEELDAHNLIYDEIGEGERLGKIIYDEGKKINIDGEWEAFHEGKKALDDAKLDLDDYIYQGTAESIDLDKEQGMLQEAMATIKKAVATGNELDEGFQLALADALDTFQLEGSLLDDLGWQIVTDVDGKKVLEGIERSISTPTGTTQVSPVPLKQVANVAYNVLRASRDMFTATAKKLNLHRKSGQQLKRSDIMEKREALKGTPKPPSAASAAYKEDKTKGLARSKLTQKKAELGQRQRVMREDAKLQSELLDRDIAAAKDHVEQLAYDRVPSTRHPGSKSVEFNRLADDLLLTTKRRWARHGKTVNGDTPYSDKDFQAEGKAEIERAEEIARDWRFNGDNTTFVYAQDVVSTLGAKTYNYALQDYKALNKINNEAFKLVRSELENKVRATGKWAMGADLGNGVAAAYTDGNRTFHVLETLLTSTSKASVGKKSVLKMDWAFYFLARRLGLGVPATMGAMATKNVLSNTMNIGSVKDRVRSKYVYQLNKMTKWGDTLNNEMIKGINAGRKLVMDTSVKFVEGLGVPPGSVVLRLSTQYHGLSDKPPEEAPKRGPGRPRKEPKASKPTSALFTPMDVLAVNNEEDRGGDSRRDAYWKRAREITAAVNRPLDADNVLTAAYEPISLWDAPLAEHLKLNAQKELEYLGSILTKNYDMQGNPEPTQLEIDRLELALNVLANTKASIYDRFLDGTLDNFSMEVFNNLRPKSAIEFKEAVSDIGQRYGHMIPYQKQLVMSKITNMNLGSVPTANLVNGIQAVVYAPDEEEPSMGNKPLGIASRTETPLEKGVQRDEWGVRARPEMTLGMV